MNGMRWMKLIGFISGIVLLNVFLLSPGFVGLEIGRSNAMETAAGATVFVMSIVVLVYVSHALLFKTPPARPPGPRAFSRDDYVRAFRRFKGIKAYKKEAAAAMDQMGRMEKKKAALLGVLGRRFEPSELSFQKFAAAIIEVEKLFYLHLRGILNKLSVVHAAGIDVPGAASPHRSEQLIQEKTTLYQQYVVYATGCLSANEGILLKLDQLLLEITKLSLADHRDVMEMACMKEIDVLINQTKFYKP